MVSFSLCVCVRACRYATCVRCNSLTLMLCRPLVGLSKPLPHNKYFCFYTFFFFLACAALLSPFSLPFAVALSSRWRERGRNDYKEGSCSGTKAKAKAKQKQKSTHRTNNFCFLLLFAFFSTRTHTATHTWVFNFETNAFLLYFFFFLPLVFRAAAAALMQFFHSIPLGWPSQLSPPPLLCLHFMSRPPFLCEVTPRPPPSVWGSSFTITCPCQRLRCLFAVHIAYA